MALIFCPATTGRTIRHLQYLILCCLYWIPKQEAHGPQSSPELQFQIALTCLLDWHDDSCVLDLKLHNLLTGVFCEIGDAILFRKCLLVL